MEILDDIKIKIIKENKNDFKNFVESMGLEFIEENIVVYLTDNLVIDSRKNQHGVTMDGIWEENLGANGDKYELIASEYDEQHCMNQYGKYTLSMDNW